jgi:hypothetical protein
MRAEHTTIGVATESAYGTWPTADKQLLLVKDATPTYDRNYQAPAFWSGDPNSYPSEFLDEGGNLSLPSDLVYENYLPLYESLMGAARGAAKSEVDVDIDATSGVLTTAGAADFSGFQVGDMLFLDGAGIAPNVAEWYGPVLTKSATALTLAAGTTQLADFAAGGQVRIRSRRLIPGNTDISLAWEMQLLRLTNRFIIGEGYGVGQIEWNIQKGNFLGEVATLMGQEFSPAAATAATGTIAAKTTDPMRPAQGGVGRIYLADGTVAIGAPLAATVVVSEYTQRWTHNQEGIKGLPTDGPQALDRGNWDGSQFTARVRLDDTAWALLVNPVKNNTTMQAGISVKDKQGNRMFFFHPACRPQGDIEFGTRGTTVFHPLTFPIHDPVKDGTSIYNAAGFGYQHAMFFVPVEALP